MSKMLPPWLGRAAAFILVHFAEVPMSSWHRDFSFAARLLARSPRFAIMVVLILAVGIASNTVIFSTVQSVFLRPLTPTARLRACNPSPCGDRACSAVPRGAISRIPRAAQPMILIKEARGALADLPASNFV